MQHQQQIQLQQNMKMEQNRAQNIPMSGEIPQPRFGHTITLVSQNLAVLFGGAIGDTGKYTITGDTYSLDLQKNFWKKLSPNGMAPTNRAAHCSLCIDVNQLVIFGGAVGGGGLADDNLYALDLKKGEDECTWLQIPVVGHTPGRRYGHAMVFIKPFLLINGGNTGAEPVNDVWCLNLEKSPYNWVKLECGESPCVRVYHSAALCQTGSANGMMVIFGGRTSDQSALNDTWGLRRHRDGKWDWVRAPYKAQGEHPSHRYQHSTYFLGTLMFVLGGRSNLVGEVLPFEIYDTESSDWFKFQAIQRFRHTLWCLEGFLYIHGGFDQETPNIPTETMLKINLQDLFKNHPILMQQLEITSQKIKDNGQKAMDIEEVGSRQNSRSQKVNQNNQIRLAYQAEVATTYNAEEQPEDIKLVSIDKLQEERKKLGTGYQGPQQNQGQLIMEQISDQFINQLLLPEDYFMLPVKHNFFGQQIKRDSVIKLLEAVEKIFKKEPILLRLDAPVKIYGNLNGQLGDLMKLFKHFGAPCEHPDVRCDSEGFDYLFLGNYINRGTRSVEVLFLLFAIKIRKPESIFLLRGNQEDKKMAKIYGLADECAQKFNEDVTDPNSVYARICKVFEYMPIAALVEDRILCVHGGIGQTLKSISEIELIQRPLEIIQDPKMYNHKITLDLLWSDPVLSEKEQNDTINREHDTFGQKNIVRFGTNRINKFMNDNGINMIIRSHEPVVEGFETLLQSIITVFSNTDYGGKYKNAAGVIILTKMGEIIPKIINSSFGNSNQENRWLNLPELYKKRVSLNKQNISNNDDEYQLRIRPPTPPRNYYQ